MSNINTCTVSGRLTADPVIKYTASNLAICSFSIANNVYSKSAEKNSKVNFFNVVAFGKTAETIEKYMNKGSRIFITGQMSFSKWQDKASGQNRSKVEIIVNDFEFVDKRSDSNTQQDSSQEQTQTPAPQQQEQQPEPAAQPEPEKEIPKEEKPAEDMPESDQEQSEDFNSSFESPIDDPDDIPF